MAVFAWELLCTKPKSSTSPQLVGTVKKKGLPEGLSSPRVQTSIPTSTAGHMPAAAQRAGPPNQQGPKIPTGKLHNSERRLRNSEKKRPAKATLLVTNQKSLNTRSSNSKMPSPKWANLEYRQRSLKPNLQPKKQVWQKQPNRLHLSKLLSSKNLLRTMPNSAWTTWSRPKNGSRQPKPKQLKLRRTLPATKKIPRNSRPRKLKDSLRPRRFQCRTARSLHSCTPKIPH